jgi:hypothetical protein
MPEHVANHNIKDAAADGQCDSFRSGLDVMTYSFSVLESDVKIFQFLLMCQPLVFFPSSFVIQAKVLRVIIGSKWRSFEHPSRQRFFRPKHMQNWQRTTTTSEDIGSRAVMESPYCMACFVWKGVLQAPAL